MGPKFRDAWYYPPEIAHDLDGLDKLSEALKQEAYACAWEYTRCVIPQYTNWKRYVAFMRIIIMGIIAEFRGDLVDVETSDSILGYSLTGTLDELFKGTPGHELMAREYKTFLLVTAEKASKQRNSELFRRYVNGLASSPRVWFRMRDCDALARFTMAAALACNDLDAVWPSDAEFELLAEIGDTLYDAVAFYKHRSEGETNSTFGYVPASLRVDAFRVARETLWAVDIALARRPEGPVLMNFVRFFGGPIHMMMRRYRFVEEDLTVGRAETSDVVAQTRKNVKLWNRVDATITNNGSSHVEHHHQKPQAEGEGEEAPHGDRYRDLVRNRADDLMFPELPDILERAGTPHCDRCRYRASYGAKLIHRFGGVELCHGCRAMWRGYVESLPERAKEVYPELVLRAPPALEEAGKKKATNNNVEASGTNAAIQRLTDEYVPDTPRPLVDGDLEKALLNGIMDGTPNYTHGMPAMQAINV